jgi:cytidylate kinase
MQNQKYHTEKFQNIKNQITERGKIDRPRHTNT